MVNTGYATVEKRMDANSAIIRIPNEEVMSEFIMLVTELAGIEGQGLREIIERKYYAGLEGEILCIGLAHDKKRCAVSYRILNQVSFRDKV